MCTLSIDANDDGLTVHSSELLKPTGFAVKGSREARLLNCQLAIARACCRSEWLVLLKSFGSMAGGVHERRSLTVVPKHAVGMKVLPECVA
jgi:hypothetical protein